MLISAMEMDFSFWLGVYVVMGTSTARTSKFSKYFWPKGKEDNANQWTNHKACPLHLFNGELSSGGGYVHGHFTQRQEPGLRYAYNGLEGSKTQPQIVALKYLYRFKMFSPF